MSSSSPPPSPPREKNKLISARRLVRIPGTGELIASPFPSPAAAAARKKKTVGGGGSDNSAAASSSSSSSSSWESTSAAAARSTTATTLSRSGKKRLVAYSVTAPRNLTAALRPGRGESAKKKQQREEAEAAKVEEAALAVASCTLRPFLTTTRAFAAASARASEIGAAAPTNAGVLCEAARAARRAAAF